MPRINTEATTKQELLNDRVDGFVNWALDTGGYRRERTLRELARRYPNASKRSVEAAYDHVISARSAGRRYNSAGRDKNIPAAALPSNTGLPTRYRWTVYTYWNRGDGSGTDGMYTIVELDYLATVSEVGSQAYVQVMNEIRASGERRHKYPGEVPTTSGFGFTIVNAERRAHN